MTTPRCVQRLLASVLVVALMVTTMSCGTIIYPERRGQPAGKLDIDIVILDAVGHIEGIGLGELLARMGKQVSLAMPLPTPINLDAETVAAALPRAVRAGVRFHPTTVLASIGDHEATLVNLLSGKPHKLPVDHVVIRTHGLPDDALYLALKGRVQELVRVGDAVAVRLADRAIFDGHIAGRRV